jgi:hypothetical protein
MHELLELVNSLTDDWWIVTSPSYSVTSYVGKIQWMRKHLHDYRSSKTGEFNRYCITHNKLLLANPFTLLIDDREQTCLAFREAGGNSALFPTALNSCYEHANNPMPFIKENLYWLHNRIRDNLYFL